MIDQKVLDKSKYKYYDMLYLQKFQILESQIHQIQNDKKYIEEGMKMAFQGMDPYGEGIKGSDVDSDDEN